MLKRPLTEFIHQQMAQLIPGGVNSPVRSCAHVGQMPMIVDHAAGDMITDVDGNRYIDYCCSWGALIHGHAHPDILSAVTARLQKGTSFGISTPIEGELAREVVSLVDSIEKIRFVSTGTEATMTVARLARGYTQRNFIVKFIGNYHGHADFFLVQAGSGVLNVSPSASSAGIPHDIVKYTISLPYNDCEALRSLLRHPAYTDNIAAVILEPVAGNMGVVPATAEFIKTLREETEAIGTLLIFDEVMTGFRVSLKGAQGIYGVKPDLTCFGKIIGGGFPAAAFGGRREIMDFLAPLGPVYQAGTLSGNPIAMEAGLISLKMVQQKDFYKDLNAKADFLLGPINEEIRRRDLPIRIQQKGSMFTFFFCPHPVNNLDDAIQSDTDLFGRFFRFLFQNNIYIPPSQHEAWFISQAHTFEHLLQTQKTILLFLKECFN
ncbi:MAG: glutamate-1-semialdehyde 2,1-aminomutase [Parachlamydia sp.]|jgi:glutamate-1-semialdehyde 2,1-aminomutase|nr:glutamate-1-semialdehyde 2,1-aminomutase [Parachlamydia sp.]